MPQQKLNCQKENAPLAKGRCPIYPLQKLGLQSQCKPPTKGSLEEPGNEKTLPHLQRRQQAGRQRVRLGMISKSAILCLSFRFWNSQNAPFQPPDSSFIPDLSQLPNLSDWPRGRSLEPPDRAWSSRARHGKRDPRTLGVFREKKKGKKTPVCSAFKRNRKDNPTNMRVPKGSWL